MADEVQTPHSDAAEKEIGRLMAKWKSGCLSTSKLVSETNNVMDSIRTLEHELAAAKAENDILRGLLPKVGGVKCPYCALDTMAKCVSGFPGCSWADDLMVGDDTHSRHLLAENRRLREALGKLDLRNMSANETIRANALATTAGQPTEGKA